MKVEPCIVQSAFRFSNGKRIIVYTNRLGVKSFECDEKWKPNEKPFAECSLNPETQTQIEYHTEIRAMHKDDDLVTEHSNDLSDALISISLSPTLETASDLSRMKLAPPFVPPKRGLTKKRIEAEAFVDICIEKNGAPPTYRQVAEHFGFKSTNTAYARLKHCRNKMKVSDSVSRINEFSEYLTEMEERIIYRLQQEFPEKTDMVKEMINYHFQNLQKKLSHK